MHRSIALLAALTATSAFAQTADPGPGNSFVAAAPYGPPPVARAPWTPIAPTGDVIATLTASGRFTYFLDAVYRSGQVKAVRGNVTMLAPADSAFLAMPTAQFTALMADRKALKRLVAYHILPGRVDAAAARGARTPIGTAEGSGVSFDVYKDRLGVNDAVIVQTDLAAANGLIHVIDKVLVPPPPPPA